MRAYLARLNAEQEHPRELVGFFFARHEQELCDLVDECCDVHRVEVLKLGPGGIYWAAAIDHVVPHPRALRDEAPGLPGDACVSDLWLRAIFDENEADWRQLAWPELEAYRA